MSLDRTFGSKLENNPGIRSTDSKTSVAGAKCNERSVTYNKDKWTCQNDRPVLQTIRQFW